MDPEPLASCAPILRRQERAPAPRSVRRSPTTPASAGGAGAGRSGQAPIHGAHPLEKRAAAHRWRIRRSRARRGAGQQGRDRRVRLEISPVPPRPGHAAGLHLGVPAVVDLAAMRDAVGRLGGDVTRINPLVPHDLVIDHSVQVDRFPARRWRSPVTSILNTSGTGSATSSSAGPSSPSRIFASCPRHRDRHQVNLEYLGQGGDDAGRRRGDGRADTLVDTDSHTTMINALGVLGYRVSAASKPRRSSSVNPLPPRTGGGWRAAWSASCRRVRPATDLPCSPTSPRCCASLASSAASSSSAAPG